MASRKNDVDINRGYGSEADDEDEEEGGLDLARIKQIILFFLRAPRRHRALALSLAIGISALAILAAAFMPRTYTADVRILAQRNQIIGSLTDPRRAIPSEAENPTRGVADLITKRDNLVALVKQTNLVERWTTTRPPALVLKDKITAFFSGPMSNEAKERALVALLERRLTVLTDNESIVISVDWSSPDLAYELVNTVYTNFLDARYDTNVKYINEAIAILEARAATSAENVDNALAEVIKKEQEMKARAGGATPAASASASASPSASASSAPQPPPPPQVQRPKPNPAAAQNIADLTQQLEDTRRQIRTIEDERRRRIADAESQLMDAQTKLGPLHPTVMALMQKYDSLRVSPPELQALRAQEKSLVSAIAAGTPEPGTTPTPIYRAPTAPGTPQPPQRSELRDIFERDDAPTAFARNKLQTATGEYSDILNRIATAQTEREVAQAAFKYTYTVARPAEIPYKPRKPNVPVIVVGGIVAAIFMALLASGLRDLAKGVYIETWQVEATLKLPVLAELPASLQAPAHSSAPPPS